MSLFVVDDELLVEVNEELPENTDAKEDLKEATAPADEVQNLTTTPFSSVSNDGVVVGPATLKDNSVPEDAVQANKEAKQAVQENQVAPEQAPNQDNSLQQNTQQPIDEKPADQKLSPEAVSAIDATVVK